MSFIQNNFSNREIATVIWVIILFLFFTRNGKIRKCTINVLRIAVKSKLLAYYFSFLLYISAIVYMLAYFNLWDKALLKDTILWFIFSGIVTGFEASTKHNEKGFWKGLILDNLKIIVVVEFIISSYSFSFVTEMIIIPLMTMVVMIHVVGEIQKKQDVLTHITNGILLFFGAFFIIYTAYMAIQDFQNFSDLATLKAFLFPVILIIISYPYLLFYVIVVRYDDIFIRLKLGNKRSPWLNFLIWINILLFCRLSFKRLKIASNMSIYNIMSISSKTDIKNMTKSHREALFKSDWRISEIGTKF